MNKVKCFFLTSVLIFLFCCGFVMCNYFEHNYSIKGKIISQEGMTVRVEDNSRIVWTYKTDRETFATGENVIIYFNTNITHDTRNDDYITKIIHN